MFSWLALFIWSELQAGLCAVFGLAIAGHACMLVVELSQPMGCVLLQRTNEAEGQSAVGCCCRQSLLWLTQKQLLHVTNRRVSLLQVPSL